MSELVQYKHNYKLSDEDKRNIVLEYTLNRNKTTIENICKKYHITDVTMYNVLNKYTTKEKNDIVNQSINEYKKNFVKKSHLIINKALEKISNKLENEEDNVNLSQLSTAIGILYDKTRLEENLSTSNNSIKIDIKIE